MKKLLYIEFLKLKSYTNFWVIISLHLGLFILSGIIATSIEISIPGFDSSTFFQFPLVWNFLTWLASWFNLLLAILMIMLVGNEFSFKTFRQQTMDGLSRSELLNAKIFTAIVIAAYCMLVVFVVTFIFGVVNTKNVDFLGMYDSSYFVLIYFIQAMAYMMIGILIALLVKNTALSILFFFLYFFPVEPIVRNIFPDYIGQYFPMKVISNLTPMPNFLGSTTQASFYTSSNGTLVSNQPIINPTVEVPMIENVIIAMAYIALFIVVSQVIIKRRAL